MSGYPLMGETAWSSRTAWGPNVAVAAVAGVAARATPRAKAKNTSSAVEKAAAKAATRAAKAAAKEEAQVAKIAAKAKAQAAKLAAKAEAKAAKLAAKAAARPAAKSTARVVAKAAGKAGGKSAFARVKIGTKAVAAVGAKRKLSVTAALIKSRKKLQNDGDNLDEDDDAAIPADAAERVEQVLGGKSSIASDEAQWVASQTSLLRWRVSGASILLRQGFTVPFIARYRKDSTGSMNEEELRTVERCLARADVLEARRVRVSLALWKQGALTDELRVALLGATVLEEIEDIWAPFKTKRKTRGQMARDRGLAPLAKMIEQGTKDVPTQAAMRFVSEGTDVLCVKDAFAGARDIVAERWAHRTDVKQQARKALERHSMFEAKRRPGMDQEGHFKTYWEFGKGVQQVKPYQFLAIQRGEAAKALSVSFGIPAQVTTRFLDDLVLKVRGPFRCAAFVDAWEAELRAALTDSLKRLIIPSLEREWRRRLKERSDDDSFDTFRRNLRSKLLLPPLRMHPQWGDADSSGAKFVSERVAAVIGVDPAYRSGCKLALVTRTGRFLDSRTVYPNPPHNSLTEARVALHDLIQQGLAHGTSTQETETRLVCSVGNGTASRETVAWIRQELGAFSKQFPKSIERPHLGYCIVDEAGASVYSASALAAAELPGLDVTMRGAVSIARRLLDSLSELVKIDPQSIGVGLYQHDVDQKRLARELKGGTEDCVNAVGVDLNTASPTLLGHVAGLSASLAQAVVDHRENNGPFRNRDGLLRVKGLGPRAFQQAAGFVRVYGGSELLDTLPIHPESYEAARELQRRCGPRAEQVAANGTYDISLLAQQLGLGLETLKDVAAALAGTAEDPRQRQPPVRVKAEGSSGMGFSASMAEGCVAIDAQEVGLTADTLTPGLLLEGVVRNVVAFGAFVDIGVGHDGLLHVSEYRGSTAIPCVNDRIDVRVLSTARRTDARGKENWKISLSMRQRIPDATRGGS
mmetsp:Transcript_25173/g.49317  ORF Transcript_25173/g.49317 Transcript_25173/m.49317 type:complete len:979 (-) Transcript_25173:91-3027(-)